MAFFKGEREPGLFSWCFLLSKRAAFRKEAFEERSKNLGVPPEIPLKNDFLRQIKRRDWSNP